MNLYRSSKRPLRLLVVLATAMAPALANYPRLENATQLNWYLAPVPTAAGAEAPITDMIVRLAFDDLRSKHHVEFSEAQREPIPVTPGTRASFISSGLTEGRCSSARFQLWAGQADGKAGDWAGATRRATVLVQVQGVVPQSFRRSNLVTRTVSEMGAMMEEPLLGADQDEECFNLVVDFEPPIL